jgi:hypothetical protein
MGLRVLAHLENSPVPEIFAFVLWLMNSDMSRPANDNISCMIGRQADLPGHHVQMVAVEP